MFECPLCHQEVSKKIYEKITGVWQEKEKKLAALKLKEKNLLAKEKKLKISFENDKKKILAKQAGEIKKGLLKQKRDFIAQLKKQKLEIQIERKKIETQFKNKLSQETNKILKAEKIKQKKLETVLKRSLEMKAKQLIQTEKNKIKKQTDAIKKREKIALDRNNKLIVQFKSMQGKKQKELESSNKKIKLLEEQIEKNETAQVLGLLSEKIFLDTLKAEFPDDTFDHVGKGGDILHHIFDQKNEIGKIIYELKKVSKFNNAHIRQTFDAKKSREADYGILITNAKRNKTDTGFSITKEIIIIHPAGAMVLVKILRDHLISISKLKLTKEMRNKTLQNVLTYIQSPSFKNGVETIVKDTIDLYDNLKKEVKAQTRSWQYRIEKYRSINNEAHKIDNKAIGLLLDKRRGHIEKDITPIALPEKIE